MSEAFLNTTGLARLWSKIRGLIDDTTLHLDRTFSSDYIDKTYVKVVNGNFKSDAIGVPITFAQGGQVRFYHNPITNLWIALNAQGSSGVEYAYSKANLPIHTDDWTKITKTDVGLDENRYDTVMQIGEKSYMTNQYQKFGYTTDGVNWTIAPEGSNIPSGMNRSWIIKFNNKYYSFYQRAYSGGFYGHGYYYESADGWNYNQTQFSINGVAKSYSGFSNPRIYNEKLYIGTADGILLEFDGTAWKEYTVVNGKNTPESGDICSDFIIYKNKWIVFSATSKWEYSKGCGHCSVYISTDEGDTWNCYSITNDNDYNGSNYSSCLNIIQFGSVLAVIMTNGNVYTSADGETWNVYLSKNIDSDDGFLPDHGATGYSDFLEWNGYLAVASTGGIYFISASNFISADSYIPFNNDALISQDSENHVVGLYNNTIMFDQISKNYSFDGAFVSSLKNALNINNSEQSEVTGQTADAAEYAAFKSFMEDEIDNILTPIEQEEENNNE